MSAFRVRSGLSAPPLGTWRVGILALQPTCLSLHEVSPAGTGDRQEAACGA